MALSFLQNVKEPVIPTFDEMIQMLETDRMGKTYDFSKETFIFDLDKIQFRSKNTCTIFDLFCQFLEYYETFDFEKNMLTLRKVGQIPKKDRRPLHLENMFNVVSVWGDNVSQFEVQTMKIMIGETLSEIEQIDLEPGSSDGDWGLLALLTHLKPRN